MYLGRTARPSGLFLLAAIIAATAAFIAPAMGQNPEIDDSMQKASCTLPTHLVAFGQLMNTALYGIETKLDEGDKSGALEVLDKLGGEDQQPYDLAMLHYYRGYVRARIDDLQGAAAEYQAALNNAQIPDHFVADVRKALAALETGKSEGFAWVAGHPAAVRNAALHKPLNFVAPIYPHRAFTRGIEGEVILTFSISKKGNAQDVRVIKAEPPDYFERSAMSAQKKTKYQPVRACGQVVLVMAVTRTINYKIAD